MDMLVAVVSPVVRHRRHTFPSSWSYNCGGELSLTEYVLMYAHDNVVRDAEQQDALPDDSHVEAATVMLRMLADETRLRLMWLLCRDEYDVTTLTEEVGVARPTISQHLAKLRMTGLVTAHRVGRRVYYTARHGHIRRLVTETLQAADHYVSERPDHP